MGMPFSKKIKLFYYTGDHDAGEHNFGDELSRFIIEKLYGPVELSSPSWCNAVSVGSLMHCFLTKKKWWLRVLYLIRPCVIVWGTGFIEQPDLNDKKLLRRLDVRACRGFLTLEALKKMRDVKISKSVVLADPGLLAGRFTPCAGSDKKYSLGIVPHYVDKNDPFLRNITVKNSVLIDVQQPPEAFMKELSECELVISSSLHGLIAADSLGVPNIRMVISDKISGGSFKFEDYYSAFKLDSHETIDLTRRTFSDEDLPVITGNYKIKPEQVSQLQDALLAAFPYI